MPRFEAAIFDLDGTLLDSLGVWSHVDNVFLGRRGFVVPADYQSTIACMTARETAEYTIKRFGLHDTPEFLMQEWVDLAIREYAEDVLLRPGAAAVLQRLKAEGKRLAVGTTLDEKMLYPCLARLGVLPLFERVFIAENIGIGKHNPDFFRYAAKELGTAPAEILVFDDVADVLRAAKSAGLQTCGVCGGNSSAEELAATADMVLSDFPGADFL